MLIGLQLPLVFGGLDRIYGAVFGFLFLGFLPEVVRGLDQYRLIFTAADSLGSMGGVQWLRERSLPIVALSGRLTTAPLQVREALAATRLPVFGREQLLDPAFRLSFFAQTPVTT